MHIVFLFFSFSVYASNVTTVLVKMGNENYQEAAVELEKLVKKEKNKQTLSTYYSLLAQMPKTVKVRRKNYEYAALALDLGREIDQDGIKLARIAGDGYFDAANLAKAKKYYLIGLSADSNSDKDIPYIYYKLAYVYINLRDYKNSFKSLKDAFESDAEKVMHEMIFYDIGKIWGEAHYVNRRISGTELEKLAIENNVTVDVFKGLIGSWRKFKKKGFRSLFKRIYNEAPTLYPQLINYIYDNKEFDSFQECDLLPWIMKLENPEKLNNLSLTLNACSELTLSKRGKVKSSTLADLTKLYARLQIAGKERWAYAQLLNRQGKSHDACQQMLTQVAEELKPQSIYDNTSEFNSYCLAAKKPFDKDKIKKISEWILLMSEVKAEKIDDLVAFLHLSTESNNVFLKKKYKVINKDIGLRFLQTAKLSSNEKIISLKKIASIPLVGVGLEILISLKPRVKDLQKLVPIGKVTKFEQISLWMMQKSIMDNTKKRQEIEAIALTILNKNPSEKAINKMLISLLSSDNSSMIFKNWKLFSEIVNENKKNMRFVLSLCFQRKKCAPIDWQAEVEKDEVIQFFNQTHAFLNKKNSVDVKIPKRLKRYKLAREIRMHDKEKARNSKLNRSLKKMAANIESKVLNLKSNVDSYAQRNWYSSDIRLMMFDLMNVRVKRYADELVRLSKAQKNPQFKELADVVRDWKIQL